MKNVLQVLKPFRLYIIIAMILIFFQSMANLYLPNLMSSIINEGIINMDINTVYKYGRYMLYITIFAATCSVVATYIAAKVAAKFAMNLRLKIFEKISKFATYEFNKIDTPSLITRTTSDVTQLQNLTLMMIRMMILAPMMCIGGIIMATSKNMQLSIMFLVVIPLIILIIVMLGIRIVPLFKKSQELTDRINQIVRERLTGTKTIRALRTEKVEQEKYDDVNSKIYGVSLKIGYIFSILIPLLFFAINASSVAIIWFGSNLISNGSIAIGDLLAFIQYAMQVLFSILMLAMLFVMIPRALVSGKRIEEVLEMDPSISDKATTKRLSKEALDIEFNNVSFIYENSENKALENVSFKVKKGETLAIVGSTGSGKTTILKLLMRFCDPSTGSIKIGGIDIKDISLKSLRDLIGYIPQKPSLFSGTIATNIKYGKEKATNKEMKLALQISNADEFVNEQEEKLNSKVAQAGINYSGGQKQRLSIARAVIKRPNIYLFDDSFSALDYATDNKVRTELEKYTTNATKIIVASRISTIINADNIILLEEGKVIAIGNHEQLYNNSVEYKEIVDSQLTKMEV